MAPRSLEVPGEGKMAMEVDSSWITNACTMCGAVLGGWPWLLVAGCERRGFCGGSWNISRLRSQ